MYFMSFMGYQILNITELTVGAAPGAARYCKLCPASAYCILNDVSQDLDETSPCRTTPLT